MDFMLDTLADGRAFRTLNIVDDYTRECVAIEVDRSLPGARVVRVLKPCHSSLWERVNTPTRMCCPSRVSVSCAPAEVNLCGART